MLLSTQYISLYAKTSNSWLDVNFYHTRQSHSSCLWYVYVSSLPGTKFMPISFGCYSEPSRYMFKFFFGYISNLNCYNLGIASRWLALRPGLSYFSLPITLILSLQETCGGGQQMVYQETQYLITQVLITMSCTYMSHACTACADCVTRVIRQQDVRACRMNQPLKA